MIRLGEGRRTGDEAQAEREKLLKDGVLVDTSVWIEFLSHTLKQEINLKNLLRNI